MSVYEEDECGWMRWMWVKEMNMDEWDKCG